MKNIKPKTKLMIFDIDTVRFECKKSFLKIHVLCMNLLLSKLILQIQTKLAQSHNSQLGYSNSGFEKKLVKRVLFK